MMLVGAALKGLNANLDKNKKVELKAMSPEKRKTVFDVMSAATSQMIHSDEPETFAVPEEFGGAVELENHQLLSELFLKEN